MKLDPTTFMSITRLTKLHEAHLTFHVVDTIVQVRAVCILKTRYLDTLVLETQKPPLISTLSSSEYVGATRRLNPINVINSKTQT